MIRKKTPKMQNRLFFLRHVDDNPSSYPTTVPLLFKKILSVIFFLLDLFLWLIGRSPTVVDLATNVT